MKRRTKKTAASEELEAIRAKVRGMKPGENLEALIHREMGLFRGVFLKELLAEREAATASEEAGFSPSGVPEVPDEDA
ncbi:MAG: hypothetical protein V2A74_10130 [bacterium]